MSYQEYLEKAKELIAEFCLREYKETASFDDLTHIPLAATTMTDAELPVEVFMDLENRRLKSYAGDDVLIEVIQFQSWEDVITQCKFLDFDALMSFDEAVLDGALAQWKGAVIC